MEFQDKLKHLGINETRQKVLSKFKFICCNENLVLSDSSTVKTIQTDKLVGTYRGSECDSSTNWITYVQQLRKGLFFTKYKENITGFESLVTRPTQYQQETFGLPVVIEINDEYLIHSEGKHRLTAAKLTTIKEVVARVYTAKSNDN